MITQNILNSLKENSKIEQFLNDFEDYEILYKKLNEDEIKRLSLGYHNFLELENINHIIKKQKSKTKESYPSILCLTLIKSDINVDNYVKLKKIKIYIDELTNKIYKILQN